MTESESVALPLGDTPIWRADAHYRNILTNNRHEIKYFGAHFEKNLNCRENVKILLKYVLFAVIIIVLIYMKKVRI